MIKRTILLHRDDNVATALADLEAGERVTAALDEVRVEVVLRQDVAFAHKIALCDIPAGQPVLKYGLPIGQALCDIAAGEWVHVHNCRSDRFGFHRAQYGLNA
jgi:hypothetical protein